VSAIISYFTLQRYIEKWLYRKVFPYMGGGKSLKCTIFVTVHIW